MSVLRQGTWHSASAATRMVPSYTDGAFSAVKFNAPTPVFTVSGDAVASSWATDQSYADCSALKFNAPIAFGTISADAFATSWSSDKSIRVAAEGDELVWLGKIMLLDTQSVRSVSEAVQRLNAGNIRCLEGFCIVLSSRLHAYYLLFRHGQRSAALAALERAVTSGVSHAVRMGDATLRNTRPIQSGYASPISLDHSSPTSDATTRFAWSFQPTLEGTSLANRSTRSYAPPVIMKNGHEASWRGPSTQLSYQPPVRPCSPLMRAAVPRSLRPNTGNSVGSRGVTPKASNLKGNLLSPLSCTLDNIVSPLPPAVKSEVSPVSGSTWAPLGNLSRTPSEDSLSSSSTTLPPADRSYMDWASSVPQPPPALMQSSYFGTNPPKAAAHSQDDDDLNELNVTIRGVEVVGLERPSYAMNLMLN